MFLLLMILLSACGAGESDRPSTYTPLPGQGTVIYMTVVKEQENQGVATFTPGFNSAENAIRATLTTNTPGPSATRIPGQATAVYEGVVNAQASQGVPTFTPGVENALLVETLIQLTLETTTPTPTGSPTSTHTPRPTYTPLPGFATVVHQYVNATLESMNVRTLTPGPELATRVQFSVERTLAYTWKITITPTPSFTPTPSP